MSTTVLTDSIVVNTAAATAETVTTKLTTAAMEVDLAKCDCCGLIEECTLAYIERIRERYQGKWICGLCAEAVKDETLRCEERLISAEEALTRHLNFCTKFRSAAGPPPDPTVHLIAAMRRILRRRSSSSKPPKFTSTPSSPMKNGGDEINLAALKRSESCIPTLSLVEVNCSVEMRQSFE
ncbi:PREDICTED: uncharacterized protein LOC109192543 [Ipomoea nil]|uniref:uncharacterized protein LOC109192543 n=1 Tax=Ipomoea nil TaxID=35883 RepID=UPI00090182EF|nr:PREDICTED: uncharacterized protein LOC109192543 [Ipomoea nil]XP_019198771.1 PREDICTED: uncharacterized protein LOC109192543 [Ipomoea nil]XP_019198772.1 PREDICTED: uncharacterized protein LOC109192543 [Ipomoea nil]